ncbi:MAG TPA: type II secretion system F family protein [Nitrospirae bacterium]|nr:type II secretion system F family protein [Nitrospirota bacterium]
MAIYRYKGYDPSGKEVDGVVEAPTRAMAMKSLREETVLPYLIEEVGEKKRRWPLRRKDPGQLFFQIGIMLKSGLPLIKSLDITMRHREQKGLSHVLSDIKKHVSEGKRFSDALGRYQRVFPEVYVNMVRIAEATGGLADVLLNIAEYEERKKEREGKIKSALTYPLVVGMIGSAVVGFLLGYVVPKMEKIFQSVKIDLPVSTSVLIAVGSFLRSYGLLLSILAGVAVVAGVRMYRNSPPLRKRIDSLLIGKEVFRKAVMARITELLAFQLREGIPLVAALNGCRGVVSNLMIREEMQRLALEVEKGRPLSEGLKDSPVFDEMLMAAVLTGEKTGELAGFLERMSYYYRKDVEKIMGRLTSLAEPVFILILGLVVGFIVVSIMTPLFEMNQLVK